ncbi:TetR family transcriptional regulator [Streptomyces sp. NPDC091377]|uniref:TetR family transcriptional regulator n=1 Tax=Streptomyces sp. NPDC091377 TaxID=3365995 RepID=UPI00381C845A
MSHALGVRAARKQRTRQALLDAALELLAGQSLSGLGLREVTRAAGVAPTAFYRHFRSIEDLGVALVDEALGSLHPLVLAVVADTRDGEERIAGIIDLLACYVTKHPAHVRFLAREQHGGVRAVRAAVHTRLTRLTEGVRVELARDPESVGWSEDDLRMLAGVHVDHLVTTSTRFLEALGADPAERVRVTREAADRLRLIGLGRAHWRD